MHPPSSPGLPRGLRAARALAACAGLALGCGPPEPVLLALPDDGVLNPNAAPTAEATAAQAYARPPGAYVDAPHLLRTRVVDGQDQLRAQLGALVSTEELPNGAGQELRMERGTIRVIDQRVYMVKVPLPEPVRRLDAFPVLGLPPPVGEPIQTHRELRYHNERGMRLVRLVRQAPQAELVTEVEVWSRIPGEHPTRDR